MIYKILINNGIFPNNTDANQYRKICHSMQQYAEEYHRTKLLKLNKSDVISSLRQCTNCVHYRDDFDCDTCNEHLDKWQSNDL
jgi:hypothetical protein